MCPFPFAVNTGPVIPFPNPDLLAPAYTSHFLTSYCSSMTLIMPPTVKPRKAAKLLSLL